MVQLAAAQQGEHYIANGDIGVVLALDVKRKRLAARFSSPYRTVRIEIGRAPVTGDEDQAGRGEHFALAYAITIHKSQGSEWPMVIVMLDDKATSIASRELIYTAISRAKGVCLLLGRREVADRQVRNVTLMRRKTFLRELLQNG